MNSSESGGFVVPRSRRAATVPGPGLGRLTAAGVLVAIATAGVIGNAGYRHLEALGAAALIRPLIDGRTWASGATYSVLTPHFGHGFRVTAECTGLVLVVPLLAVAAALLILTRAPVRRVLLGAVAMVVVVTAANEFRLALIGWSTLTWGMDPGYTVSHTFIGSAIGLLGFACGLTVLVLIAVGTRRRRTAGA